MARRTPTNRPAAPADAGARDATTNGVRAAAPSCVILTIGGQSINDPVIVMPPGPWPVTGTVSHGVGVAISAMTFHVVYNQNPIRGFPAPPSLPGDSSDQPFTFSIPSSDAPGVGTYTLCVTAYYADNNSRIATANFQVQTMPPPGQIPPSP